DPGVLQVTKRTALIHDTTRPRPIRPATILAAGSLSIPMTPAIIQVDSASSRRAEGASPTRPTNRLPGSTVVEEAVAARLRRWRRFGAAFLMALNRMETPMSFPTRRTFLQTAVAAAASLFLPKALLSGRNRRSFWFLHTPTGESWAVDDP